MMKAVTKELARHPKTGNVILSRENVNEAYLEWKDGLMTHIDAEQLPDDYDKVEKYSEHLTIAIAKPVLADIPAHGEEGARALRTQIQKWNYVESMVKDKVVKHLHGHLHDTFQRAGMCHEGWTQLNAVISYDKESQVDLLEQELSAFSQRTGESDVEYAERFDTLLFKLKSVDRPNPNQPEIVAEFNRTHRKEIPPRNES